MGLFRSVYRLAQNTTVPTSQDISDHVSSPLHALPKPILILLALGCLLMAACVAGLTLGLMTLDTVGLEIMTQSKNLQEAAAARAIMPVRKNAHLLLVTLLLGNTIATELLPLVLEVLYPGGVYALLISVFSIMLFGEIIPQAVCSRHALEIGSRMIGFVKVITYLLYPIAAPIAYLLDTTLGHELGTIYSREELKDLVNIHSRSKYGTLTQDETTIIGGTLQFSQRTVSDVLTKAENVFRLDVDSTLDEDTLKLILEKGHSRIPLYDGNPGNIICTLLVKQLLLVNPSEKLPIRALIASKSRRCVVPVIECSECTPIEDMLNQFQEGQSHIAIAYDEVGKENRVFLGILTLEDIIEEILQEEIVDETDVYVDNTNTLTAKRQRELALFKNNATVVTQSRLRGTRAILLREIPTQYAGKPHPEAGDAEEGKKSYNQRVRNDGLTRMRSSPTESAPLLGIGGPRSSRGPHISAPDFPSPEMPSRRHRRIASGAEVPVDVELGVQSSPLNTVLVSPVRRLHSSPRVRSQPGSVKLRPLPTYVPQNGQSQGGRQKLKASARGAPASQGIKPLHIGERADLFQDEGHKNNEAAE